MLKYAILTWQFSWSKPLFLCSLLSPLRKRSLGKTLTRFTHDFSPSSLPPFISLMIFEIEITIFILQVLSSLLLMSLTSTFWGFIHLVSPIELLAQFHATLILVPNLLEAEVPLNYVMMEVLEEVVSFMAIWLPQADWFIMSSRLFLLLLQVVYLTISILQLVDH